MLSTQIFEGNYNYLGFHSSDGQGRNLVKKKKSGTFSSGCFCEEMKDNRGIKLVG